MSRLGPEPLPHPGQTSALDGQTGHRSGRRPGYPSKSFELTRGNKIPHDTLADLQNHLGVEPGKVLVGAKYNELQRLVSRLRSNEFGCWLWTGALDPEKGYGFIFRGNTGGRRNAKKKVRVHRHLYELLEDVTLAPTDIIEHQGGRAPKTEMRRCCNPGHYLAPQSLQGRATPASFMKLWKQAMGDLAIDDFERWVLPNLSHIDEKGCWVWDGPVRGGYGWLELSEVRRYLLHHWLFAIQYGIDLNVESIQIGQIMHIRISGHSKWTRACANPMHWKPLKKVQQRKEKPRVKGR